LLVAQISIRQATARNGPIVEIKSALILQPGAAALTEGLDAILAAVAHQRPSS
jgi:iron complex transport system substrate-binding protein